MFSGGHAEYSDADSPNAHECFPPCSKWLGAINRRQPRLFLSHSQTISRRCWLRLFHSALPVFGGATGGSSRDSKEHLMDPVWHQNIRCTCTSTRWLWHTDISPWIPVAPPASAASCIGSACAHGHPCHWMKRAARQQYTIRSFVRRIFILFHTDRQVLLPTSDCPHQPFSPLSADCCVNAGYRRIRRLTAPMQAEQERVWLR